MRSGSTARYSLPACDHKGGNSTAEGLRGTHLAILKLLLRGREGGEGDKGSRDIHGRRRARARQALLYVLAWCVQRH